MKAAEPDTVSEEEANLPCFSHGDSEIKNILSGNLCQVELFLALGSSLL